MKCLRCGKTFECLKYHRGCLSESCFCKDCLKYILFSGGLNSNSVFKVLLLYCFGLSDEEIALEMV